MCTISGLTSCEGGLHCRRDDWHHEPCWAVVLISLLVAAFERDISLQLVETDGESSFIE